MAVLRMKEITAETATDLMSRPGKGTGRGCMAIRYLTAPVVIPRDSVRWKIR